MKTLVTILLILCAATAHAARLSIADQRKLASIERTAQYEQERANRFASRGLDYQPAMDTVMVNLPRSLREGVSRQDQLKRIYPHLSKFGKVLAEYEFDVIKAENIRLIRRRR